MKRKDKEYSNRIKMLNGEDTEGSHVKADRVLCELLIELGYDLTVKEFVKLDKWYA